MPNAAATFDDDLDFDVPRRRNAPRKAKRPPARGAKKGKRPRDTLNKVARYAAVGMAATMAVGIMVNALILQKGHHPAPLFAQAAVARSPAKAPTAPARTARTADATPTPLATPEPAAKPRPSVTTSNAPSGSSEDPIARLLQGGSLPSGAKSDTKTTLGVQKALGKLGFAVKPTGTMGPSTRKAIEAFEKDRHLPIKGEMSRRLVKTLAAESGTRIE